MEEYLNEGAGDNSYPNDTQDSPLSQLFYDIESWHLEKGLSEPNHQMVKVLEEVGELAKEIAHGHIDIYDVSDAIGDSIIALAGVAACYNLETLKCVQASWEEVKNRTGKIVDGHFVKDV